MAQFAVLVYAPDSLPSADPQNANAEHADELARSGSMLAAWELTPRGAATSIRSTGVTDGPFVEAKEVVVGVYLLEAPDLDAALAIARQNPAVGREGSGVEVRPVHAGGVVVRPDA